MELHQLPDPNFLNPNKNPDPPTTLQASNNLMIAAAISQQTGGDGELNWEKAEIVEHPLYEKLLAAHVACLRVATPVDQLSRIDAQLAQSQRVAAKYLGWAGLDHGHGVSEDDIDPNLDQFMMDYVLLLSSFKRQLEQHVCVHAREALMACWQIEQSLQRLTGVSPGVGTGATMSGDDEDGQQFDSETNLLFDESLDGVDPTVTTTFGPLNIPMGHENSLMERVREELKRGLKHGYKEKIVDVQKEILRKRSIGKLPGDSASILKAWWQSNAKWPYPTEEDKGKLVQETGLQMKQINNWFVNQRKRNWRTNTCASTASMSKRKR